MKNITFGDFVRGQLKDPDSTISKQTRMFKAWAKIVKTNPKRFKMVWEPCASEFQLITKYRIGQTAEVSYPFSVGNLAYFCGFQINLKRNTLDNRQN